MQQIMLCSTDFAHNTQSHTLFLIAANQRFFFPFPTIPINISAKKNRTNGTSVVSVLWQYILKLPIREIMRRAQVRVLTIDYRVLDQLKIFFK